MCKGKRQKVKGKSLRQKAKVRFFLLLTCAFSFFLFPFSLKCYALDKIIAVVNNDAVTQKELNDFLNYMRMQVSREITGKELEERMMEMKHDLLNKLIEDKLILQEARKAGITAEDSRVKARVDEIKKQYGSEAAFQKALKLQGLTQADIEKKIREQFIMYGVVEVKVRSQVTVRPEEVTDFYVKNPQEFVTPETRECEVVALENKDQADSFSVEFTRGEKIETLAARYPLTLNELSLAKGESGRKEIEELIFALDLGAVSIPLKVQDKYYVFKLKNVIPPSKASLTDSQESIRAFLSEKKMQEKLTSWIDEVKAKSYIKVYAD